MERAVEVRIPIHEDTTDEVREAAAARAKEAAVLYLLQVGELSIREAAAELGLTYEGYLDLLHLRGLPATNTGTDPEVLEGLKQQLRPKEPARL